MGAQATCCCSAADDSEVNIKLDQLAPFTASELPSYPDTAFDTDPSSGAREAEDRQLGELEDKGGSVSADVIRSEEDGFSQNSAGESVLEGQIGDGDNREIHVIPEEGHSSAGSEDEAGEPCSGGEMTKMQSMGAVKRRAGVSAESVDSNDVADYVRPVYEKDEQTRSVIAGVLQSNVKMGVLFGHLDKDGLEGVVDAFQVLTFAQGETIIKQGDEGDRLYICAKGLVDVFVRRPFEPPEALGDLVTTLGAGELFGELALMYSGPRAATVKISSSSCICFTLERAAFKMLLANSGVAKPTMYDGFLTEVELLKSMNHFELGKLSEAMESQLFAGDEDIIAEGVESNCFYIVEDGTCSALLGGKEVRKYEKGGYFGFIALMMDQPPNATVKATGQGCSVLACDKDTFSTLPGPIRQTVRNEHGQYYGNN